MYLFDTNIISEARKGLRADPGVVAFRSRVLHQGDYLPVQAIGELHRSVGMLRRRGDLLQATLVEKWLNEVLEEYRGRILPFDAESAQIWGRLLVSNKEHQVDKQIAATALLHGLILVTRNVQRFSGTGVRLFNPWTNVVEAPEKADQP